VWEEEFASASHREHLPLLAAPTTWPGTGREEDLHGFGTAIFFLIVQFFAAFTELGFF
jgi:hypothetical protein